MWISFTVLCLMINLSPGLTMPDYIKDALAPIKSPIPGSVQEQVVRELINRTVPEYAHRFQVSVLKSMVDESGIDMSDVRFGGGDVQKVQITATSGVAAASAFYTYLNKYLHTQVSWQTTTINKNNFFHFPPVYISYRHFPDRFRYYQNVCTTSYSFVWWDWKQWEKHIDWIVMNGYNLVLAFHGQEAIWERVYKKYGLTQQEIDEHFSGPAFLAWERMGNMRGFGGPLSSAWHQRSLILQKRILLRLRNFGVTTVLPAFAGHLPRAFKRLYPNVKMEPVGPWNNFEDPNCCPYFLDPTEDLFQQIGQDFMKEQIAEFGTDHVYNCDSFNENSPASGDAAYLNNVGKSIYKAMTEVDKDAIWVMQGWLFSSDSDFWSTERVENFVTSIQLGKMIILDLQSEQVPQYERLQYYFGQPWIWCMLHNFGGTLGMFGSSHIVNERIFEARNNSNGTMIGVGIAPEGINQNYVMYELMSDLAWGYDPYRDLPKYFAYYTWARYGEMDSNAEQAWRILQQSVYNYTGDVRIHGHYAFNSHPTLNFETFTWYPGEDLFEAWNLLLHPSSPSSIKISESYRYDVVDITRQVLQLHGDLLYDQMITEYTEKNWESFNEIATTFLEIFPDLEAILGSNEAFLLGKWIAAAKAAANSSQEEELFEYNARNQITLWGPRGEIKDYANKQWAGVVSKYFQPRWKLFINYMNETLLNKGAFNKSYIAQKIFDEVEKPFTLDRSPVPTEPIGDTMKIALDIFERWYRK